MKTQKLGESADEIKRRPIITDFLKPAKHSGYICPNHDCRNGKGEDGTGAVISSDGKTLLCGKCQKGYSNIDIIADHLGISTSGKDFIEVVKFGCQHFGIDYTTDETPQTFNRLTEARKNISAAVEKQGQDKKWRGLSLQTLQRVNWGFLQDFSHPKNPNEKFPAVIIPNDKGGIFARSVKSKNYSNISPTGATTIFLPNSNTFDLIIVEGAINGASILQAVPAPSFGIIASGGTSGNANILAKLQELQKQEKKFRVMVAYDNDSNGAGQKAAVKLLDLLKGAGFIAVTIDITKNSDIDLNDVLQQQGNEELAKMINSAVALAQVEFDRIEKEEVKNLLGDNAAGYFMADFQNYVKENQKYVNRKTGFSNLDEELKSFRPGIYIFGGLPALGKTTFALQLLNQLAESGETSIFCSYEMEKGYLYSKILAREVARIETKNFLKKIEKPLTATNISQGKIYEHGDAYRQAIKNLTESQIPLHIWELDTPDIDALINRLERICAKLDTPPTICIDYIQLLATGSDNIKSTIDNALHKIFTFRRKTNTTFILISSLNRLNYYNEISFESFKETGGLEFSADCIIGLQFLLDERTRETTEKAKREIPRQIQLKCLKNRFGKNFDIGFFYYPNCDVFIPMEEYGEFIDYHRNESGQLVPVNEKKGSFKNEKV